jgi:hypothetical protein
MQEEKFYSFEELTRRGSDLYLLGDMGKKAAHEVVERHDRILATMTKEERDAWRQQAFLYSERSNGK